MASSPFLKSFLEGNPPKNLRLVAAQGLAPIPPSDMLRLLVHLTADADPEVSAQAAQTIGGWTEEEITPQLRSSNCDPSILDYFAQSSPSSVVQEAIILNASASGDAVESLAARVPPALMEVILYNRVRLLEHPGILSALKRNPAITNQIQVMVQDIESEFFTSKKTEYVVEVAEQSTVEKEELQVEGELSPEDLALEGLPLDPEEREAALLKRISMMTVPQRIQLALAGTREARSILILDPNREVARSVLQSPKLSDTEVESFAAMRNISDEVLRQIGTSRDWMRVYGVVHSLVKNPRTPPFISQSLISRLRSKDLSLIARDRGVPEIVRIAAQRAVALRNSPKAIH
jgi:hypothetical protein